MQALSPSMHLMEGSVFFSLPEMHLLLETSHEKERQNTL